MKKVIWDDKFSIGVADIDEQHKKLFEIVNRLVDANNIKVDSNLISEILSEMTSYAQYHFAAEEKIMLKYGYPGYPVHKEQHIKFIEQTVDFCMKTINHEDDVPARLFEYLTTWLIDHVLYTDKKMKPFLRPKDIN